jgi:4,5-DOPA dioxygenase extradiol
MVHNLGRIDWDYPETGYPWAIQAGNTLRQWMADSNFSALMDYRNQGEELRLAIPTPEHYIPALYMLTQKQNDETITFFNQKTVLGAIDMTSFIIR